MPHRWDEMLQYTIHREYDEPEAEGEHCTPAADDVLTYLEESRGYTDNSIKTVGARDTMYELYLFAKWLHGRDPDHKH